MLKQDSFARENRKSLMIVLVESIESDSVCG